MVVYKEYLFVLGIIVGVIFIELVVVLSIMRLFRVFSDYIGFLFFIEMKSNVKVYWIEVEKFISSY